MVYKIVWLAVAGAAGTLARYALAGLVHRVSNTAFPLGTIVVNILGCLAAGVLWSMFENRWPVSGETRTIILLGFMGAFTTFSAYILETNELLRSAEWLRAIANILLQNGGGLLAIIIGAAIGRKI